jgi:hypothetical protein
VTEDPNTLAVARLRRIADHRLGTKEEEWEVVVELAPGSGAEAIAAMRQGVVLATRALLGEGSSTRAVRVRVEAKG